MTTRSGDPSSLYMKSRHWENSFSSRAADTEKASPAPSRRMEILEFMKQRVKGGQALGHYDGCKAGDCHMYAHTSTEPYAAVCMTHRLLSLPCTYTHRLVCLPYTRTSSTVCYIYMSAIHARRRESSRYPVWIYTPRFHTPDQIRASSANT